MFCLIPLRLGGPKIGFFFAFSGPLRSSNALPRRTSSPRWSLRLGVLASYVFSSYLLLSLTIVHWINENPNKRMKGFVQV